MNLCELIKQRREDKHLTMEQLGKLVGVQKSAVSKWEHGRVGTMKTDTAMKLAKVLDIPKEYFLGFVMEDRNVTEDDVKKDMLWNAFTQLTEENQRAVFIMINALASQQGDSK